MHVVYPTLPSPPPPRKSPNPFLYTHFLRFLLGRLLFPGEIGNNGYAKCWGGKQGALFYVKMVHPMNSATGLPNAYPQGSDLSGG